MTQDFYELRPVSVYHEDFGSVLWWRLPIEEDPEVGGGPGAGESINYGNGPEPTAFQQKHDEGWFTHFSCLPDSGLLKVWEEKS
jgi:hypothetical protein